MDISIVVIIYNRKETIRACLDSVLYTPGVSAEIICVDDHSTDGTWEILLEYAKKYPQIRLARHKKNLGTCCTRHTGLALCSGEYMTYVDGDDIFLGENLSAVLGKARSDQADIIEFSSEIVATRDNLREIAAAEEISLLRTDCILDARNYCALCYGNNRKIANQLWNKLYSKRNYLTVRTHMTGWENLPNYADILFFLYHHLYFAKRVTQTGTHLYRYFIGKGMTYQEQATIDTLNEYLQCKNTCEQLREFIRRMDGGKEFSNAINFIEKRTYMQSIACWGKFLADRDLKTGWELLRERHTDESLLFMLSFLFPKGEDAVMLRNKLTFCRQRKLPNDNHAVLVISDHELPPGCDIAENNCFVYSDPLIAEMDAKAFIPQLITLIKEYKVSKVVFSLENNKYSTWFSLVGEYMGCNVIQQDFLHETPYP